jgi:hypothetical protein
MNSTWIELRELAAAIERLARDSPCWSQVHREVLNLCDHMQAKARIQEINHRDHSK